ncbi:MAG: hypothetical protein BWY08_00263 [Bacteroidetes bacterium ADurb.Bin174]|nr:MAG: hypothetical protein BWY08_00263 [Bacteroidetes bacterium ADurb.Bin174]
MTDVLELFSGIGVIIDDAFEHKNDDIIYKIKESFEKKNIPILTFYKLPELSMVTHFKNVSFIILDWNLTETPSVPEAVIQDIIEFIKKVNSYAYLPLFIFSNEAPNHIILKLEEANIYLKNIFVKQKQELKTSRQLFSFIKKWIKETPSIYVLKKMEASVLKSKNDLFWDFQNINSDWVYILQKTITSDGADANIDLLNILFKNLIARTNYTEFNMPPKRIKNTNLKKDIRKVLECERFLTKNLPDNPCFGDIFKTTNNGNISYLLNIRPDCDIIRGEDKTELYCLKGRVVDETKINNKSKDAIKFEKGSFINKITNTYIPFIDNGLIIEFLFYDLKIKKWKDIKNDRIGRLLPPYITRVQQNYSLYSQRQGLPSIPEKAIK